MLAQFGDYYAMTPAERKDKSAGLFNASNDKAWEGLKFAIRMVAYAGYRYGNPARMQQAIDLLGGSPDTGSNTPGRFDEEGHVVYTDVAESEYIRSIREVDYANTNGISQSLNYIETTKLREMIDENK